VTNYGFAAVSHGVQHAFSAHRNENTPELLKEIKSILKEESD